MTQAPDTPDIFRAIADRNRRLILDLLSQGERPVQDLVDRLGVTYATVSQHLALLHEAGLVDRRVVGRQRLYRTVPAPLAAVDQWLGRYRSAWAGGLDRLGDVLDASEGASQSIDSVSAANDPLTPRGKA